MRYRVYSGNNLLTETNSKSYQVNNLSPGTNYQFSVAAYNGRREGTRVSITVATAHNLQLVIATPLNVGTEINLNYQEYSLGLVPLGTEPAGSFGGSSQRTIKAKVVAANNGQSTVEVEQPLPEFSNSTVLNKLSDSSFAAFNGYKAIYFTK